MERMRLAEMGRLKWKCPETPPAPRIIHLPPRRPCSRRSKYSKAKPAFFDKERSFGGKGVPIMVVGSSRGEEKAEEEKWRVEAEMLRAECNLLRMEKEVVAKKIERRKERMERTLRSAIRALLSGRERISEGENVDIVLEEEINHLVEKLQKLIRKSGSKDLEVKSCTNFDKQACHLRRRLKKFDETSSDICLREIQEMAEASLSIKPDSRANESCVLDSDSNMEMLRRKMEEMSKGVLLERMKKEYDSMLLTLNTAGASSASSSKRIELPDTPLGQLNKETKNRKEKTCSGQCKAIVRKLVQQVRAETEQWSQMQEMLHQVKKEMEELQSSRDYWEDRALDSDGQIQSLRAAVQEWRQKAVSSEKKANELQAEASMHKEELKKLRKDLNLEAKVQIPSPKAPKEPQTDTILGILVRRLKDNHRTTDNKQLKKQEPLSEGRRRGETECCGEFVAKRLPFQEIGNLSPATGKKGKLVPHFEF